MTKRETTAIDPFDTGDFQETLRDIAGPIQAGRGSAIRAVNTLMTATCWMVGRRIVEQEQRGKRRAGYGEALIDRLAADLGGRFGRGFGKSNLFEMRSSYLAYSDIFQTVSGKSGPLLPAPRILQTASRTTLPDEKKLAAEIERTRAILDQRKMAPQRRGGRQE